MVLISSYLAHSPQKMIYAHENKTVLQVVVVKHIIIFLNLSWHFMCGFLESLWTSNVLIYFLFLINVQTGCDHRVDLPKTLSTPPA